jgi:hypothetical protein
LEQLQNILSLAGAVDAEHFVLARLAQLAETGPRDVAESLSLMVQGSAEATQFWLTEKDAHDILVPVVASADINALRTADAIIQTLGRRGFLSLRDLAIAVGKYKDSKGT